MHYLVPNENPVRIPSGVTVSILGHLHPSEMPHCTSIEMQGLIESALGGLLCQWKESPILKEYKIEPLPEKENNSNFNKYKELFTKIKVLAHKFEIVLESTSSMLDLEKTIQLIKAKTFLKLCDRLYKYSFSRWNFKQILDSGASEIKKAMDLENLLVNDPEFCGTITFLSFDYCELKVIPSQIKYFNNLTTLQVSGCDLTSLPPEIITLQKLTHLNLDNNKFETIPPELAELPNLEQVILANNPLAKKNIPEAVRHYEIIIE